MDGPGRAEFHAEERERRRREGAGPAPGPASKPVDAAASNYVGEELPGWVKAGVRLRVKTTDRVGTVRQHPSGSRWWWEVEFPGGHVESLALRNTLEDFSRDLDKREKPGRRKPPFRYWLAIETPDYYQGGRMVEREGHAYDTRAEALEALEHARLVWSDTPGAAAWLRRMGTDYPRAGMWKGKASGGWLESVAGWQLFPGHPDW
jgi:hypothetical protein